MQFELVLSLIVLRHLRKNLQTQTMFPKWDKIFIGGMVLAVLLIMIDLLVKQSDPFILPLGHLILISIVFIVLSRKEFRSARFVILNIIPLIILSVTCDLMEAINNPFFLEWEEYFRAAVFFASLWMVAIFYINGRQRKALQKEKLKTLEIEKINKITEKLKEELEVQVAERTAALTLQKEELQETLLELKSAQSLLIQSEKMASLGELTAGIAHEIQNPLNFVNNFSEINEELIKEMLEEIEKAPAINWKNLDEIKAIANDIEGNSQKINYHGKRADAIVKGMLQHSRTSSSQKEASDLNKLTDEYLRLAYHGLRAKDKSFNATMQTHFDENIGTIQIIPQDIGRVVLNLFTNAFYSLNEKKKKNIPDYKPTIELSTKKEVKWIVIIVKDNGLGIPKNVIEKIFQPFYTTKPSGEGTGLGLSLSYDIIKAHGGELKVNSEEGEGAEFVIHLPY